VTTENLAILFTDVVGSTELSQRVSPDRADEVRRAHFSILRQAVATSGGTEVKNLGDGLMVVFTSASAALTCAVAMQQGVEQANRGTEPAVGLRVGIAAGDVVGEDHDYFGDPVIEAVRLCALCASGQVLATALVRATAGRRIRHECRPVGELTLKGLPEAVESVEVLWEPLASTEPGTSVPLPRRLGVRPFAGVVGRETDLVSIHDALKRVSEEEGREVVLVSGEAGLGKTTLVAEAARSAFKGGACVLFGHCEEEVGAPYELLAEALGHYVAHAPENRLRAHLERYGSELARLAPALASRIPDLPETKATDSDSERYLLFAAVVGLLCQMSIEQPVVLVLDDLQWADRGSLQLLHHLVSVEVPMRVLILATYRDSELSHASALVEALGALRRQIGVSRIELTGLDDSGVVTLMEAVSGQRLDDADVGLAHAIYRETDGNPFFVIEVLRHLAETGAIIRDDTGRWVRSERLDEASLPDGVREVIGARVVRLGKRAGEILSVAAVVGRDFDLDLVAKAARATDDEVLDVLDAAAAAALVRELEAPPGRYGFAHSLIQRTLYEDLGPTRRARRHRRVAEALEELCGGRPGNRVGELARHWFSATQAQDLDKALEYSRQAADAALAALAPADALHYYTQALDLLAQIHHRDPVIEVDVKIGLGAAQRQTGNPAYRDTLLEAAHRAADLGDNERLAAAALANDRGFFSAVGLVDVDKVKTLETALARLPADHLDRPPLLASLCRELTFGGPLERRRSLADEAIAMAKESDDPATLVRVLNHVSYPLLVPPLLEQSLTRTADAMDRAEQVGDPVLLLWAIGLRSHAAACAGDIDEMDRCLEGAGSLVAQLDQPPLTWVHTVSLATRSLIAGDPDEAGQLAKEALRFGTGTGEPDAATIFGAQIQAVSFQSGTMGDLVPIMEQAAIQDPAVSNFVPPLLAMAHAEADGTDQARLLLDEFAAKDFVLPLDTMWLSGMVAYAEAAIECRVSSLAEPVFQRLRPWADQLAYNGATSAGPVSHFLGGLATVLKRYEMADDYFVQAQAFSERVSAKYFSARTNLSHGRMLLERHGRTDREKARRLLTNAQAAAEANGYGNVERRAAAALEALA
jgi:class 3 adenylate cyclase